MATADEERARRIEDLVQRVERISNAEDRDNAQQLMSAILDLHGSAMARMLELAAEANQAGDALIRRYAGDHLIANLLVLHGLHPDDLETRVRQVLAKLTGKADLISISDDVVRVRIGPGCGLKEAVSATLREAVPDAGEIFIEETANVNAFVPLAALGMLASG